jgi:hypothetical protein
MMQAAARAYRLNQTHEQCKTYYIFAEGTMEHTAVQLMSRKQRAAKLLTGDVGLTGLDALTEQESGFEEALLNAIAKEEVLLDPSEMFKVSAGQSEIDAEDMAYWNVEVADDEPEIIVTHDDPLVQVAIELGSVLVEEDTAIQTVTTPQEGVARTVDGTLCAIMDETTSPSKFSIQLQGGEQGQRACQSHRKSTQRFNQNRSVVASQRNTNSGS